MTGLLKWVMELFAGRRPAQIKVRVNFAKNGGCWNYDLEADDQQSGPFVKAGNKIVFPHKQPTSTIEFRLQGQTGHALDFDLDINQPIVEPIWVQVGQCPTQYSTVPNEISIVRKSANRLTIQNRNLDSADIYYCLNFVDGDGNKVHWDPIIRNTGGGGP